MTITRTNFALLTILCVKIKCDGWQHFCNSDGHYEIDTENMKYKCVCLDHIYPGPNYVTNSVCQDAAKDDKTKCEKCVRDSQRQDYSR